MSKAVTWLRRALLVATAAFAAAGALGSPVYAQSPNNQALMEQVNRLQRELSTLHLYVYRGESRRRAPSRKSTVRAASIKPRPPESICACRSSSRKCGR